MTYALDTNIISFYLKGNERVAESIRCALLDGDDVIIAPIAYYEIRRGLLAVDAVRRLTEFDNLCALLGIGKLDNSVLDAAAEIYAEQRKEKRSMEDADILIAACCRKNNMVLVTNNTRHFQHIADLRLCDWTVENTS
jgi:predicted nucleic acid-binding protein